MAVVEEAATQTQVTSGRHALPDVRQERDEQVADAALESGGDQGLLLMRPRAAPRGDPLPPIARDVQAAVAQLEGR